MPEDVSFVVRVLLRHDIPTTAARLLESVGADLLARTEARHVEAAALVDLVTGQRVGDILEGSAGEIDIGDHLRLMRRGRRYLQIHSHPGSSSLSAQDAVLLVTHAGLLACIVVGLDGSWYILSKTPGGSPPLPERVAEEYSNELVALQPRYVAAVKLGMMSQSNAWRELSHEVWLHAAVLLSLRYDRIEPT
jgi:hypothetical protein